MSTHMFDMSSNLKDKFQCRQGAGQNEDKRIDLVEDPEWTFYRNVVAENTWTIAKHSASATDTNIQLISQPSLFLCCISLRYPYGE